VAILSDVWSVCTI